MLKAIKGVSEETWQDFKALAAREHVPMGKLLEAMVQTQKQRQRTFWDRILNRGKTLSDEEAKVLLRELRRSRREYGFRKSYGTRP